MSGAIVCTTHRSADNSVNVKLVDIASNQTVFESDVAAGTSVFAVNTHMTKFLASRECTVSVICMSTNTLLNSIDVGTVTDSLVVNNVGSKFIACDEMGLMTDHWFLWDVETGSPLQTLTCVILPKFSCDDRYILTPCKDTIQVWDENGLDLSRSLNCEIETIISGICAHPSKSEVVLIPYRFGWVVWDFEANTRIDSSLRLPQGSWILAIKFGSEEDVIFAKISSLDSICRLVALRISTCEELFAVEPQLVRWKFDYNPSDNTLIVVGVSEARHLCYSASTGELLHERQYQCCWGEAFMRANVNILL